MIGDSGSIRCNEAFTRLAARAGFHRVPKCIDAVTDMVSCSRVEDNLERDIFLDVVELILFAVQEGYRLLAVARCVGGTRCVGSRYTN